MREPHVSLRMLTAARKRDDVIERGRSFIRRHEPLADVLPTQITPTLVTPVDLRQGYGGLRAQAFAAQALAARNEPLPALRRAAPLVLYSRDERALAPCAESRPHGGELRPVPMLRRVSASPAAVLPLVLSVFPRPEFAPTCRTARDRAAAMHQASDALELSTGRSRSNPFLTRPALAPHDGLTGIAVHPTRLRSPEREPNTTPPTGLFKRPLTRREHAYHSRRSERSSSFHRHDRTLTLARCCDRAGHNTVSLMPSMAWDPADYPLRRVNK